VNAVAVNPITGETLTAEYGYLFWLFNGAELGFNVGNFYCTIGVGGEDICISPKLDRVSVQQRDYEDGMGNLIMAALAFDESVSFESNTTDTSGGECLVGF
jgi:hypothetical protein